MMYTHIDFKKLEVMSDDELHNEIEEAKRNYIAQVEFFNEKEIEAREEAKITGTLAVLPNIELHTQQLHNIESYIRKAENILSNLEELGYYERVAKLRTKRTKMVKLKRKVRL